MKHACLTIGLTLAFALNAGAQISTVNEIHTSPLVLYSTDTDGMPLTIELVTGGIAGTAYLTLGQNNALPSFDANVLIVGFGNVGSGYMYQAIYGANNRIVAGEGTHIVGLRNAATNQYTFVLGSDNLLGGSYNLAFGSMNQVVGDNAAVIGWNLTNTTSSTIDLGPANDAKITVGLTNVIILKDIAALGKLSVGSGVIMKTNAASSIPAAPATAGDVFYWNSNGAVFAISSWPTSATWTKTNLLFTP